MYLLFHKEECPYCLKVRQYMSDKNIPYISVVSKTDAPNRKILMQLGGKAQVPFLVNLTTADTLYESNDIIQYLEKHTK